MAGLSCSSFLSAQAEKTASEFQWPFNNSGIKLEQEHFFHDDNLLVNGTKRHAFHAGEDWALAGGTPLYAIANGTVEKIIFNHEFFGNCIRVKYNMPYGKIIYFDYIHCQNGSFPYDEGKSVSKGKRIARSGRTGTGTGTGFHLHMNCVLDRSASMTDNPYYDGDQNEDADSLGINRIDLTPEIALKYVSPSLVFSDWTKQETFDIEPGWPPTQVEVDTSVPSWLTYITDNNGEVYSIGEAVSAGIIHYGVLRTNNGKWYRSSDPDKQYISQNSKYGVWSNKSCTLHVCEPQHTADAVKMRAMQDSFLRAEKEGFDKRRSKANIHPIPNWNDHYDSYLMRFSGTDTKSLAAVHQATNKKYPFVRYTRVYKNGAWGTWSKIDTHKPSY